MGWGVRGEFSEGGVGSELWAPGLTQEQPVSIPKMKKDQTLGTRTSVKTSDKDTRNVDTLKGHHNTGPKRELQAGLGS